MKKIIFMLATILMVAACQNNFEDNISTINNPAEELVIVGYSSTDNTRTAFGTPDSSEIPFYWTKGDYVWLGTSKSKTLAEDTSLGRFSFDAGAGVVGTGHIFYNMTGEAKTAHVLAEQSADGNLGNDGDFGYSTLDEYNTFYLEHKTAYVWFDTKTTDSDMPKLEYIRLQTEGIAIAGKRNYNFNAQVWDDAISEGSSSIVLNFEGGYQLKSTNSGIMAAMVVLPSEVSGTKLCVTYGFEDGSTYSETKYPSKDFTSGATQRIATTIKKSYLVQPEPELPYELRVLTFEDEDAKFTPYILDYAYSYAGAEINRWSDLIDEVQYYGPLTYGNDQMDAMYWWYDEGNTELYHMFPDNWAYCFWGGGHAISNYWGEGYADENRNEHIAKYYGEEYVEQFAGNDMALGWFLVQMMTPIKAHSGDNFCIHYGYKDFYSYIENLPELSFADGEARVIDHMWVTNTNYTLNQLYNGVKSEAGNSFGGNWEGLSDDAWLKIVAQGFDDVEADAYAEPISEAEFYLVQGEEVVTDWQKWDLSSLGKVAKVRFNFLYSDDMGGSYGFTIPGYFAYDDIAVRFDK